MCKAFIVAMFQLYVNCLLLSIGVYSQMFGSEMKRGTTAELTTILNHVNQLEAGLRNTITELQATRDDLMTELEATRDNLKATKAELLEQKQQSSYLNRTLNTTMTEIQVTKNDLESTRTRLHAEIQALKNELALKTITIAFSAYIWDHISIEANVTVKFDTVEYNAGNGYNTTTGKFTAPVNGTYIFCTEVETYFGTGDTYIEMLHSGTVVSEGYGRRIEGYNDIMVPVTAIIYVKQREQVWIQPSSDVSLYGGARASHFVGALLSSD